MIAYLDSSVVLQWLLQDDPALEQAASADLQGSSELLWIETHRVLERIRLLQQLDDDTLAKALVAFRSLYASLTIVPLSRAVQQRAAESFPTSIGTLDAIHLASALLWGHAREQELQLFSYDKQLNICAQAVGASAPLA